MITSLNRHQYTLKDFVGKDQWVKIRRVQSNVEFYIKVLGIYGKFDNTDKVHRDYIDYRAVLAVFTDEGTLLYADDPYIKKVWTSALENLELISPLEVLDEDEVIRLLV